MRALSQETLRDDALPSFVAGVERQDPAEQSRNVHIFERRDDDIAASDGRRPRNSAPMSASSAR
jgi:hypothetical protein